MALLAVAAGVLVAGTSFETQRLAWVTGPQATGRVPAWTRPCWRRREATYALPCGRVHGRVLHVQQRDPDGDGDRHLVVLAGAHVVIVKVVRSRRRPRLPGIGRRMRAVGLLSDGRLGRPVVETDAVRDG